MSMTEVCEICVPSKRFLSVNALRDHQRHKFHMQGHRHCAKCGPVVAFNSFEQIDAHYKEVCVTICPESFFFYATGF